MHKQALVAANAVKMTRLLTTPPTSWLRTIQAIPFAIPTAILLKQDNPVKVDSVARGKMTKKLAISPVKVHRANAGRAARRIINKPRKIAKVSKVKAASEAKEVVAKAGVRAGSQVTSKWPRMDVVDKVKAVGRAKADNVVRAVVRAEPVRLATRPRKMVPPLTIKSPKMTRP